MLKVPPLLSAERTSHYGKAPIREAIIDIQVADSPTILKSLPEAQRSLPQGYAHRQDVTMNHINGQLQDGTLTTTSRQEPLGYAFIGDEGKHVTQFRVDGFSFSRLAPYETWEQLRTEAMTLWHAYRRIVGSASIARVGLRYVNQLDLPLHMRDLRDYLRSYPEVSTDLTQQLAGFFMQVQIPQPDLGAMLILNQALVPPPNPNVVSVVLDIDLFKQGLTLDSDEEAWDLLDVLRMRKNLIFEGCITNNTRNLIK